MLKWLWVILALVCVLAVAEWIREICTFQITHYEIQSPKLKNVKKRKIVLLSDLHNCSYGKGNEKLIKAIKNENPDLILIAGDMLTGKESCSTETALDFVKQLPAICGTYYANGNHEQRMKENTQRFGDVYQEYKEVLCEAGVHYLENETACLQWEECDVEIHGVEVPKEIYHKFGKVPFPNKFLENQFGEADPTKYQILIAHNPIFMSDYLKWGADLIVSGHMHGGIVRIPFWRGIITPRGGLFPKYSGEMTKIGDSTAVVSKGIGVHTIKIRFLNPAEVVVLHVGDSEE